MGDVLLIASGRRPNVEGLALEEAGVRHSAQGIEVYDTLRTTQKHIYAAGDNTGGYQFTHYAAWQAAMAVHNALLPGTSKGIADRVAWTTFTDPEAAHVGLTEEQARRDLGDAVKTYEWPVSRIDRAVTERRTEGFIKLICGSDGRLLGTSIVAERAGEMIHEWIVALDQGIKIGNLSDSIHVYPTFSIGSQQAAADVRMGQLFGGLSGKILRGLVRLAR